MARRASFEDENIHRKLVEAIKVGAPHELACMFARVSKRQFYEWMRRGRDNLAKLETDKEIAEAEHKYVDFFLSIKEAEANMDLGNLRIIQRAAESDIKYWHAAAWLEERRHPEWFALTNRYEHSGPGGGPIQTDTPTERVEQLTDAIVKQLEARRGIKQLGKGGAGDGGQNGSHLRGNGQT